ncbi:hypothetical protein [Burkholderia vietnamiensis]|jgi:hypothetical protein|nr:hypothetical protein [Burkholderia vietnamiensis]
MESAVDALVALVARIPQGFTLSNVLSGGNAVLFDALPGVVD